MLPCCFKQRGGRPLFKSSTNGVWASGPAGSRGGAPGLPYECSDPSADGGDGFAVGFVDDFGGAEVGGEQGGDEAAIAAECGEGGDAGERGQAEEQEGDPE